MTVLKFDTENVTVLLYCLRTGKIMRGTELSYILGESPGCAVAQNHADLETVENFAYDLPHSPEAF
jgi:hypothetical protein